MQSEEHTLTTVAVIGSIAFVPIAAYMSYSNAIVGYIIMAVVSLVGLVAWRELRREGGGVALPVVCVGVVVGASTCGIRCQSEAAKDEKVRRAQAANLKRQEARERENERVENLAREHERAQAIEAKLNAPKELAVEATGRLRGASGRLEVADAICFADFVLSLPDVHGSAFDTLSGAREAAAKSLLKTVRQEEKSGRTLVCRDGASSDCLCSESHRGCCSNHRGVARCQPVPKIEISCAKEDQKTLVERHLAAIGEPIPPAPGLPSRSPPHPPQQLSILDADG